MMIRTKKIWSEILAGALICGFLIAPLYGQTKKRPGGSTSKQPAPATDRDLKPKTTKPVPAGDLKSASTFYKNKRLALIIGNSDYDSSPLRNPVNDANLVGKTLENIGFQVTVKENLKLSEMKAAVQEFSGQLAAGGVGLFYFAGHGIQIDSRNFLIPVDFNPAESDVAKQAVEVDLVIRAISSKSALNILILDACRNAPKGFTASNKGLAEIKNAPAGTYIAFSTAPGKTAKDGAGDNSPYTESLAANLQLRPSRLEDVFIRTRIQMDNKTRGEQTPWESSSIRNIFYFTEDTLAQTPIPTNLPDSSGLGGILNLAVVVPVFDQTGRLIRQVKQNASYFMENEAGLEMMRIRSGNFLMGTSWQEIEAAYKDAKRYNEQLSQEMIAAEMPQHKVNMREFFMSRNEITQAQWQSVMGSLPNIPANFRGPSLPVVNVSWRQANQFCQKLSLATGKIYRLPTEAEWEYAARAGTETPFSFGQTINSSLVNFKGSFPFLGAAESEFRNMLIPVGSLKNLNGFGLADIHGNVWEWTADNWHEDYNNAPTDGSAWEVGGPEDEEEESEEEEDPRLFRVIRGGSWDSIASNCRSTSRRRQPQMIGSNKIGFRVVMQ